MARIPHAQPGVEEGQSHSPLKVPCKKLEPLMNAARLRFALAAQRGRRPGGRRLLALLSDYYPITM